MSEDSLFGSIAAFVTWLESPIEPGPHADAVFIVKLGEEAGEAAQAYIGMTGANPRKGVTHTREEFLAELADVVYAGATAIQHFTQDAAETERIIRAKLERLLTRLPKEESDDRQG